MKVTLKDIAEDTGYSVSTVSRVLNSSQKMSQKAQRVIYQSARKLNYSTYGEKLFDSLTISLVITQEQGSEFFASSFYHGLNVAAQQQNILISATSLSGTFREKVKTIEKIIPKEDGLIIFAPEFSENDYEEVFKVIPENYPVISNNLIESPVFPTVAFDGYGGGYLAAKHFRGGSYYNCGIIRSRYDALEGRNRSHGFRDYISRVDGMELSWVYEGNPTFESGRKAFKTFHDLDKKPRAIFVTNDNMCHAFHHEALTNNYAIPEDIALIGYEDTKDSDKTESKLTSIQSEYQSLGEVSIARLKQLLLFPDRNKKVLSLVPVSLKERDSA